MIHMLAVQAIIMEEDAELLALIGGAFKLVVTKLAHISLQDYVTWLS